MTTPKLPEPATDKDSLTVVAWAATRTKDGKQTLLVPCITTNPAYVETHSRWDWKPHAVDHDQAQALAGEVERLRAEVAAARANALSEAHELVWQFARTQKRMNERGAVMLAADELRALATQEAKA